MNKRGPIIIIEDDLDDQHILTSVLEELKVANEVLFFQDGEEALKYLQRDDARPFLIISDINMPRMNGFELRKKIHSQPKLDIKCAPYIFFSTAVAEKTVMEAYKMSVQGMFLKPPEYGELLKMMRTILSYWELSHSPNNHTMPGGWQNR